MRRLPVLLLGLIATSCGCRDPEDALARPPDIRGMRALPVESLEVERVGERHVVRVTTRTSTSGWEVQLLPWQYSRPPVTFVLDLVGTPAAESAEQVVTSHEVERSLALQLPTKAVQVRGSNGAYKEAVPWSPAGR